MFDSDKIRYTSSSCSYTIEKYSGGFNERTQKHGEGNQKWTRADSIQKYNGKFFNGILHNEGTYAHIRDDSASSYIYEGSIYANQFEGYARVVMKNATYFEGLFKGNRRFGPGVLTYNAGGQDVGLWDGLHLIRLAYSVSPAVVPTLAQTAAGRVKLLKYRRLVALAECNEGQKFEKLCEQFDISRDDAKLLVNDNIIDRNSLFFNHRAYQDDFGVADCFIDVALNASELSELNKDNSEITMKESEDSLEIYMHTKTIIEDIFKNMGRVADLTNIELELMKMKRRFVNILMGRYKKQENCNKIEVATKRVEITHILAWNNEEICVDLLKHTFRYRNREHLVTFNVNRVMRGERDGFGEVGEYESACRAFLRSCAEGNVSELTKLHYEFDVNPDLMDGKGNSGVMFAVANNHNAVITKLVEYGANLEAINDEGITPLNLALLRYIATKKRINDWEMTFMQPYQQAETNLEELSAQPTDCHSQLFKANSKLILHQLDDLVEGDEDMKWLMGKLNASLANLHDETNGNEKKTNSVNYLFNFILPNASNNKEKKHKQKQVKSAKKEVGAPLQADNETNEELDSIFKTIRLLLTYGVDVSVGDVPAPSTILALYTENVEIVELCLKKQQHRNANEILFGDDSMNLLHILMTFQPSENLIDLVDLVIEMEEFDVNARAGSHLWRNEFVEGETMVGMTALHMLAIRNDFSCDTNRHLIRLAVNIISEGGGDPNLLYLGHSALTLAMLRGNLDLVEVLLENGADPNQLLGDDLGVPLIVYLKSKQTPHIAVCRSILDLLVRYYANPFNAFGQFANLAEFFLLMDASNVNDKKQKKKNKKTKKKNKLQDELKAYLMKLFREVADRHCQGRAVAHLIHSYRIGLTSDHHLAALLTPNDLQRILQFYVNYGLLRFDNVADNELILHLFQYIEEFGMKTAKSATTTKNKKKIALLTAEERLYMLLKSYEHIETINVRQFEFDLNEEKYKVCYHCGVKTGEQRELKLCPQCHLFYFCSEKCNKLNVKQKKNNLHQCRQIFYKSDKVASNASDASDTKASLPRDAEPGIDYAINVKIIELETHLTTSSYQAIPMKLALSDAQIKSFIIKKAQPVIKPNKICTGPEAICHIKFNDADSVEDDANIVHPPKRSHSSKKDQERVLNYAKPSSERRPYNKHHRKVNNLGLHTRLPRQYQLFMEKVAELFPNYDLSLLYIPFVCFKEGQLYYRFPNSNEIYYPTYSAL